MKTVVVLLGTFLRGVAVFISLIAGAVVLIIAGWLGKLDTPERMQSNELQNITRSSACSAE